jgi:tetratricopeptide (TPR) repeat protein
VADRSAAAVINLPPELSELVEALAAGATEASPDQLAAIARWRLACGDGRSAGRWHRWSLEAPPPSVLRQQLRDQLLEWQQPDLAARLGAVPSWAGVRLALEQQQTGQALELQQQAIAAGEPISLAASLQLASLWQGQAQPQPALALLLAIAAAQPQPSTSLCNAIAHLYDQVNDHHQAAPWWDRSLQLDPRQPAALIQRSRNALALRDQALAFQLAEALHQLDPDHPVAQELRVEALEQLQAPASLRLALVPLVRARRERYRRQARRLAPWWAPLRRQQSLWRPATAPQALALAQARPVPAALLSGCSRLGLLGSADGLELAGSLGEVSVEGVVWLLESPEPLCALHNLRRLMSANWEVQLWPCWAPQLHGALDLLIEAGAMQPPTRADAPDRRLHWREGRWQPCP